jgi:thiamine biosynthesis lipoprotein
MTFKSEICNLKSPMNRRDFLAPHHLARSAGHALGAFDDLRAVAHQPSPAEFALLRFTRRAMATDFEIAVPFGTPGATKAAKAALDEIDRLEAQLTVYRDNSDISRLNQGAAQEAMEVEERLFSLLEMAARLTTETGGAFDITAGALVKAWGFFRGPRRVPDPDELAGARARAGMGHVELDRERRTVRFKRPGLEINLGSIGKGYALDRAAEVLRDAWGVPSSLLHGGHSSIYAMGTEPGEERGWTVGLSHPWQPDRRLALLHLRDQALGTSAATFRHLEYNGRKLGHILDPRTGWPAEGMASASVVAPTAAEADGLATAFFILGVDSAKAYCDAHPGIGAVLLPEGEDAPVVVGLGPDEIEVLPPDEIS